MIIPGLIAVYLLGLALLRWVFPDESWQSRKAGEVLGLSFLIGIGVETVFLYCFDLAGIPVTRMSLLLATLAVIVPGGWHYHESIRSYLKQLFQKRPARNRRDRNIAWIILLLAVIFMLAASAVKSLYWPTTSYDSVAGYDLMGKVIAEEGRIIVSLFDIDAAGKRGIYPPLIEGSFAYAYLWDSASSKIITTLTFLSLALVFYAQLRRYTSGIGAMFFLLLMVITPELYAHSSLSLSNMPGAAYAATGLIYLFIGLQRRENHWIFVGAILLGLNVWARNDGIVFNLAGLGILTLQAWKDKQYRTLLIAGVVALLPLLAWTLYLKYKINIVQDRFVNHLFWDGQRFTELMSWVWRLLSDTQLYGITFIVFVLALLLNVRHLPRDKPLLLTAILVSFLLYTAIYYQFDDTKQDPLVTMMRASYKRALFYFVPLVLFYTAVNQTVIGLFEQVERFRLNRST